MAIGDAELQIAYIGACNVQRVFVFPSLGIWKEATKKIIWIHACDKIVGITTHHYDTSSWATRCFAWQVLLLGSIHALCPFPSHFTIMVLVLQTIWLMLSEEALKPNPFQAVMLDWTSLLASCGPLKLFSTPYLFFSLSDTAHSDCILFCCYARNHISLLALLLSSTAKFVVFACQR